MNYQSWLNQMEEQQLEDGLSLKSAIIKTKEDFKVFQNHKNTKEYDYHSFKASYDYVNSIFPEANILDVKIYEAPIKLFKELKYDGAGGLYSKYWKAVVVPNKTVKNKKKNVISTKLEKDVVIVHELLHYVSDVLGHTSKTRNIEEEFAYGYMIKYALDKGYTEEKIINDIFMPWLVMCNDQNRVFVEICRRINIDSRTLREMSEEQFNKWSDKHNKDIIEIQKEIASELGKKILVIYMKKLGMKSKFDVERKESVNRFGLMEI